MFGRSGSAPVGPSLSPHARVRSAPPARPRFGVKTPSAEVPTVAWIPSIPGRIVHGSSPVPSLRIYSGTNSVSSSRGPSCKAKQPVPNDSGGEAKTSLGHDHSATTDAQSSKKTEHLLKESSVIRPCSALTNPRAKWKCDDKGWSKFSTGAHRCMLLTPTDAVHRCRLLAMSTQHLSRNIACSARTINMALHKSVSYAPADVVAHETKTIINRKTSMSVQTEDIVDALQRIINVRTASSQTGLLSSLLSYI